MEWESNRGHHVTLGDVSLDELCEAERRALQEVALAKLNKMDFNIPSSLVKGECVSANSGGHADGCYVCLLRNVMVLSVHCAMHDGRETLG